MKCLALQGGGCLGYGQAIILSNLETVAKKTCAAVFDIIGGTSVGAIIGAHLAVGISASDIESFFTTDAPNIFSGNIINDLEELWGAKYSPSALETALQARLKDLTLADCKTKFIATSYDWSTDRPVYFKSYEKSSSTKDWIIIGNDSPIKLWQICRSSAAAQTYFPAYQYNGMVFMDGGNTGDNAPDVLVISDALDFSPIADLQMLSIGAGDTNWNVSASSMINPSIAVAGLNTIKIVFSAGESAEVYKASKILRNKYSRIVPNLGNGYAIDDASTSTLNSIKNAAELVSISNLPVFASLSN
jgi:predicted acylesterase/phospholipase RssA